MKPSSNMGLSILALAHSLALLGIAQTPPSPPVQPLFQIVEISGDQYAGLTRSCLMVYSDGRFHHEERRQRAFGRSSEFWDPAEVFEGALAAEDLRNIRMLIESADFESVRGSIGTPPDLRSRLSLTPAGGVVPIASVEIFEASVSHPDGPQLFESFGTGSLKSKDSVKLFASKVREIEKERDGRVEKPAPNDCSDTRNGTGPAIRSAEGNVSTRLAPKPIFTPSPNPSGPIGKSAKAMIDLIVEPDGSVGRATVNHGVGPILDQVALEAVKKWKFEPAFVAGIPIPMLVTIQIDFHLLQGGNPSFDPAKAPPVH